MTIKTTKTPAINTIAMGITIAIISIALSEELSVIFTVELFNCTIPELLELTDELLEEEEESFVVELVSSLELSVELPPSVESFV